MTAISAPTNNFPTAPAALAAGITALNARGGLNGHRVEMVFCNDRSDPNQTAICARHMVDEKVVMIAGGSSTYDGNSQPILAEAGIPMVGIAPITPNVFNEKNVYLMSAAAGTVSYQAGIAYAARNNLLPVALAVADNPGGKAFTGLLEKTVKDVTGGDSWAAVVPVATDTADFAPIAGTLDAAKPKSVVLGVFDDAVPGGDGGRGGAGQRGRVAGVHAVHRGPELACVAGAGADRQATADDHSVVGDQGAGRGHRYRPRRHHPAVDAVEARSRGSEPTVEYQPDLCHRGQRRPCFADGCGGSVPGHREGHIQRAGASRGAAGDG